MKNKKRLKRIYNAVIITIMLAGVVYALSRFTH